MHMSMFYRKGPMPISPESHQSIENNEKCTVFDTVTHHDDSRSPAPSLRWQRLVSGVQLAYGWGYITISNWKENSSGMAAWACTGRK